MQRLLAALCVSTILTAPTAWAQDNQTGQDADADSGEIIVTAQRRAERLIDVPISISALSGNALEQAGIRSTEDLTAVIPGLNFATNGAFAQPTVRGIGTTVTSAGNDANVAIYIDGVYQPNQIANFSDLVDLEQVEVLKGPQGTLFGRNATGGAIRVTTKRPSFTPEARLTASYGRFDDVRLTAFGTAPLSDKIAVSFAFLYGDDQGYVRNIGTGNRVADSNAMSVRGKILLQPTDGLEFILTASRSERSANPAFTLGVLNGNSNALRLPGSLQPVGPRQVSLSFDPTITVDSDQVSLNATADLGFAELSSITSYAKIVTDLVTDVDRTNLALVQAQVPGRQETWSQELNLVSQGDGPVKWFVGAFYYNDDSTNATIVNNGAVFNTIRQKTEAFAPFGEINVELGDLTLIAGARYNIEKRITASFAALQRRCASRPSRPSRRASACVMHCHPTPRSTGRSARASRAAASTASLPQGRWRSIRCSPKRSTPTSLASSSARAAPAFRLQAFTTIIRTSSFRPSTPMRAA